MTTSLSSPAKSKYVAARIYEAHQALARGWTVYRANPLEKNCYETGWHMRPSLTGDEIEYWGARGYNFGVLTGPSGLVVIDVDTYKGARVPLDVAATPTVVASTCSGGRHFYFLAPAGAQIATMPNALGPGVDVLASGTGHAPLPGTHARSKVSGDLTYYRWVASPRKIAVAPLPPIIAAALTDVGGRRSRAGSNGEFESRSAALRYYQRALHAQIRDLRARIGRGRGGRGYALRTLAYTIGRFQHISGETTESLERTVHTIAAAIGYLNDHDYQELKDRINGGLNAGARNPARIKGENENT